MIIEIKRIVKTDSNGKKKIWFESEVNGKRLENEYIIREIVGNTWEEGLGVFDQNGGTISFVIGNKIPNFYWEPLSTDIETMWNQIQERINDLLRWVRNLEQYEISKKKISILY